LVVVLLAIAIPSTIGDIQEDTWCSVNSQGILAKQVIWCLGLVVQITLLIPINVIIWQTSSHVTETQRKKTLATSPPPIAAATPTIGSARVSTITPAPVSSPSRNRVIGIGSGTYIRFIGIVVTQVMALAPLFVIEFLVYCRRPVPHSLIIASAITLPLAHMIDAALVGNKIWKTMSCSSSCCRRFKKQHDSAQSPVHSGHAIAAVVPVVATIGAPNVPSRDVSDHRDMKGSGTTAGRTGSGTSSLDLVHHHHHQGGAVLNNNFLPQLTIVPPHSRVLTNVTVDTSLSAIPSSRIGSLGQMRSPVVRFGTLAPIGAMPPHVAHHPTSDVPIDAPTAHVIDDTKSHPHDLSLMSASTSIPRSGDSTHVAHGSKAPNQATLNSSLPPSSLLHPNTLSAVDCHPNRQSLPSPSPVPLTELLPSRLTQATSPAATSSPRALLTFVDMPSSKSVVEQPIHSFQCRMSPIWQLICTVALPILLLIVVSGIMISTQHNEITTANHLSDRAHFTSLITSCIHQTQRERGLAFIYLSLNEVDFIASAPNTTIYNELVMQYAITNTMCAPLHTSLVSTSSLPCTPTQCSLAANSFSQLSSIRENIMAFSITKDDANTFYTSIQNNWMHLSLFQGQTRHGHNDREDPFSTLMYAHVSLLRANHWGAILSQMGNIALTSESYSSDDAILFQIGCQRKTAHLLIWESLIDESRNGMYQLLVANRSDRYLIDDFSNAINSGNATLFKDIVISPTALSQWRDACFTLQAGMRTLSRFVATDLVDRVHDDQLTARNLIMTYLAVLGAILVIDGLLLLGFASTRHALQKQTIMNHHNHDQRFGWRRHNARRLATVYRFCDGHGCDLMTHVVIVLSVPVIAVVIVISILLSQQVTISQQGAITSRDMMLSSSLQDYVDAMNHEALLLAAVPMIDTRTLAFNTSSTVEAYQIAVNEWRGSWSSADQRVVTLQSYLTIHVTNTIQWHKCQLASSSLQQLRINALDTRTRRDAMIAYHEIAMAYLDMVRWLGGLKQYHRVHLII
jgi:hypothetical protein